MAETCWAPIDWGKELQFQILIHFLQLQSTFKQHDFRSFQRWNQGVSRFWSRVCSTNCNRSRPGKNNLPPGNSKASLELGVDLRTMFLGNHLAQVSITPNQQGTFEITVNVFANAGAQDKNTSGCKLSHLEVHEFFWELLQLALDAVFRPRIGTPFSPELSSTWSWEKEDHPKTLLCWMNRKTKRTLLQHFQCLSVPLSFPGCSDVALLEDGLKMCRNFLQDYVQTKFVVCVCVNLFKWVEMFHYHHNLFPIWLDMCEMRTVLVLVGFSVAVTFFIYRVRTQEKLWQHRKNYWETVKGNRGYCLTRVCYYLLHEDIVGVTALGKIGENDGKCSCGEFRWDFFSENQNLSSVNLKRSEIPCFTIRRVVKKVLRNLTSRKSSNLKPDTLQFFYYKI